MIARGDQKHFRRRPPFGYQCAVEGRCVGFWRGGGEPRGPVVLAMAGDLLTRKTRAPTRERGSHRDGDRAGNAQIRNDKQS